ncbi:MAG: heavy-metal-associated domain-containing protein, partial [Sphingomonadaceae bacterium]
MRALLVVLALLFAAPALAQAKKDTPEAVGEAGGLVVSGIAVDETAKTDIEARLAGWRAAQRLAWPQLWARLAGGDPKQAPRLPDSALDQMVSAIEVERESAGRGRYVAQLSVVFDRTRAATFLGRFAPLVQSPPMLAALAFRDVFKA